MKFRTQNIHFSIKTHPKSFVSNFWDAYHFDPVPFLLLLNMRKERILKIVFRGEDYMASFSL